MTSIFSTDIRAPISSFPATSYHHHPLASLSHYRLFCVLTPRLFLCSLFLFSYDTTLFPP
jgi:hypothetical protein